MPLFPVAAQLTFPRVVHSSFNKMVPELKKKRERAINKKSRPRQYSGSQLCLGYYHILRFSGRKGTLRNSRMGGAAFLYDLIWKIKSLGKYNLFRLSRPCCANLQSGSTLWRSKNIYFILWGIKAFNECIIKTKKVYTALEIPRLSQAINIQGTIPSCDSTCFLFGLQPSYKPRYYVTTQPSAEERAVLPSPGNNIKV